MITTVVIVAAAILVPIGLVLALFAIAGLVLAAFGSGETGIIRPRPLR